MSRSFLFPTDTRHAIPWFAIRAVDGYVDEYQEINGDWIYFNSRPDMNIKHGWQIFDEKHQSEKKPADLREYQKALTNLELPSSLQLDQAEVQDKYDHKSQEENNLLDSPEDVHTQDNDKTANPLGNPTDQEVISHVDH